MNRKSLASFFFKIDSVIVKDNQRSFSKVCIFVKGYDPLGFLFRNWNTVREIDGNFVREVRVLYLISFYVEERRR